METVYLRPEMDVLYLPHLDTLGIEHFVGCESNHVLKEIAVVGGDISKLSFSSPATSTAVQIILGLPKLEIVYAVEGATIGGEAKSLWRLRAENPDLECVMLEVPENSPYWDWCMKHSGKVSYNG